MSIDWNWGIFFTTSPVRQHHLSWLDLEWFSGDDRFVDLRRIIAFLVGSFFGILRTVPNRFSPVWVRCMSNCSATCR